jgi:hypothetical protein
MAVRFVDTVEAKNIVTTNINATNLLSAANITANNLFATNFSFGTSLMFRNRLINGDMRIDQRFVGTGISVNNVGNVTTVNNLTVDRWGGGTGDCALTFQQGGDVPPGFTHSLEARVDVNKSTLASLDTSYVYQIIEGYNCQDLDYGTINAKGLTLSFWVKSTVGQGGIFAGCLRATTSPLNFRSFNFTYTINQNNTWEYKTIYIPGDTGASLLKDNRQGLALFFDLGSGANNRNFAGPGIWSGGSFISVPGAVSLIQTAGAIWRTTGVQLEVGPQSTPFEVRNFSTELALCQRYFCKTYSFEVIPGTPGISVNLSIGVDTAEPTVGMVHNIKWPFPVTMRTIPTMRVYSPSTGTISRLQRSGSARSTFTDEPVLSIQASQHGLNAVTFVSNVPVASYERGYRFYFGQFTADAEL